MRFSCGIFALAALGLDCAITDAKLIQHRHLHKHRRDVAADMEKRGHYVTATQDFGKGPTVFSFWTDSPAGPTPAPDAPVAAAVVPASQEAAPTPAPQNAAAEAPPAQSSSSTDTGSSGSKKVDSKISSSAAYGNEFAQKSDTFGEQTPYVDAPADQQWLYKGNSGKPYASNMIFIDDSKLSAYNYTNIFKNNGTEEIGVRVWNKVGHDSQPNSGQNDPKPALHFKLQGGESKTVAFDCNSQVAWSQDNCASNMDGSPQCTWGEANFDDTHHGGFGGCDTSMVFAGNHIQYMGITAKINGVDSVSSIYENSFHVGQENIKGEKQPGINWGPGPNIHLTTYMTSLTLSSPP